jgi:hypothetical protein
MAAIRLLAGRLLAAGAFLGALPGMASPAAATEFRSVGARPAILYDAPSRQAVRLFVAPPGMPVEVISTLGQWLKVRDMTGDVSWIERADITERRMLVVLSRSQVHAAPDEASAVLMVLERGVLLEPATPPSPAQPTAEAALPAASPEPAEVPAGWVGVRHRDGGAGFVRTTAVWGR